MLARHGRTLQGQRTDLLSRTPDPTERQRWAHRRGRSLSGCDAVRGMRLRAQIDSIKHVMPVKNMAKPTRMPSIHNELEGYVLQIMIVKMKLTTPSRESQPPPVLDGDLSAF